MDSSKGLQLAPPVDMGNVVLVIVYLVLIIVAAYFLTKFFAKRSLRRGMKEEPRGSRRSAFSQSSPHKQEMGRMVSVVDRIAVDRDKTLMVVEFEGSYYLLGTTADGFEKIDRVDIPEAEAAPEGEETGNAPEETDSTFSDRFKQAFGVVLRSYLPKGVREKKTTSFDRQLQERIKADNDKAGKKSG